MLKIGPQDMGRKRLFENNNLKYEFEAIDPYGHIFVTCLTKREKLDGKFTTFKDAENAATTHSLTRIEKK